MPGNQQKTQPAYEERITLFIDFLAFKEHVKRTTVEPEFLGQLLSAMERVGEIGKDDADISASQRVTQFSDCIVVSYRVDEPSAVFWLLNEIAFCVVDLVERGFLLRGGLTAGDLYHTEKHIVGPAMNRAYEMESKEAIYPRVIVDESVIAVAKLAHSEDHDPDEEEGYVRAFLTEDEDGKHFFDYTDWEKVITVMGGESDDFGAYLETLSGLVGSGLAHTHPCVQQKYLWLHARYAATVRGFAELPANDPYRLENYEMCDGIAGLPDFKEAAEAAQRAVDACKAKAN